MLRSFLILITAFLLPIVAMGNAVAFNAEKTLQQSTLDCDPFTLALEDSSDDTDGTLTANTLPPFSSTPALNKATIVAAYSGQSSNGFPIRGPPAPVLK
ncbi:MULTISPECIES: hypothetical protein [unclassified Ketobacter]|uniref:hypothetical protein n=1 Tax=unclassified Ketobacter TaxID=2639109 RepID=UPI000F1E89D4|nr:MULTISPECIES: hypothetical protein [unclassified Ketobacter]RLT91187.1 MAG: hypothetical protein D9N13_02250 [Ketobacter sp. GenoA1]RLT98378.1 MAG: hypothetical protein D9N15_05780 [Ketobacter sp.]